jgi:predicted  nucleic acid-binding Zn-ribbon protein
MAKTNDISVEEKLRALYDLQIIDSRLDEIRNTRGELPIEVEDLEIEIEGLEKRAEKFHADIKDQDDQIKTKHEVINHAKTLIEKYKSQQDNVRNNKEFEALGKKLNSRILKFSLLKKELKNSELK